VTSIKKFVLRFLDYINDPQLQYGVPLDNRADFTKTDWEMWVAAMEDDTVVHLYSRDVV